MAPEPGRCDAGRALGTVKSSMKELTESGESLGQFRSGWAALASEISACIRSQLEKSGVSPPRPQDLSLWCQDWSQRGEKRRMRAFPRQISYLEP
jgi:hypothetical protein